jgi:hypothetical protein
MVIRILGSRLAAAVGGLAARAMGVVHDAYRPSGVAGGLIADLTRSRAELSAENVLLRQQLLVVSRAVKDPNFRGYERGLLVLLARLLPRSCSCQTGDRAPMLPRGISPCSGVESPARPVRTRRASLRMSSP